MTPSTDQRDDIAVIVLDISDRPALVITHSLEGSFVDGVVDYDQQIDDRLQGTKRRLTSVLTQESSGRSGNVNYRPQAKIDTTCKPTELRTKMLLDDGKWLHVRQY